MTRAALFIVACALAFSQTSSDGRARQKNIRDLAKLGADSIPKIAPYVSDPEFAVRLEAVKALTDIGGPKTLDGLLAATNDKDPEIQIRATEGIVNVYVPGYLKVGVSGTIQRTGDAIRAKFGLQNDQIIDTFVAVRPEVIPAITRLVRSGTTWESRAAAARAAGVLRGRAALDDLIEALRSKEDQLMFESLIAIQKINDRSAGPRIAFRLRDLDDRIQITTLETTGLLKNVEAAPEVIDAMDHARNPKIRHAAAETLAQLARPIDHAFFSVWLNDHDDAMRIAGAEGLGRLKQVPDRAILERDLKDEHSMGPRLAVVFALVSLGNLDLSDLAPLRYLINTLNNKGSKQTASAYLIELAQDPAVRKTLYTVAPRATKDEKIGLSGILGTAGDKDSVPILETLSMDPDAEVAQEGIRGLRTLRARLP